MKESNTVIFKDVFQTLLLKVFRYYFPLKITLLFKIKIKPKITVLQHASDEDDVKVTKDDVVVDDDYDDVVDDSEDDD